MKVEYIDHMGTDLSVVNAARVSMDKKSEYLFPNEANFGDIPCMNNKTGEVMFIKRSDVSLITFLAKGYTNNDWINLLKEVKSAVKNQEDSEDILYDILVDVSRKAQHWSPFAHTAISLRLTVPFPILRQIDKHQVGFVTNEISRRYIDYTPEVFKPEVWRGKAEDKKQGSNKDVVVNTMTFDKEIVNVSEAYEDSVGYAIETYEAMIKGGVCAEQARLVLPQGCYTSIIKTGSLLGWARLYNQRSDPTAQYETQEVAEQVAQIIGPLFPVSWTSLTG